MLASRPFLLRALYEWVLENQMTPHIVVDAECPGVRVPRQFVQEGQITLNVAPSAVQGLQMTNADVTFSARFGGMPMQVVVPIAAVLAIYARENGQGMGFGFEPGAEELDAIAAGRETGEGVAEDDGDEQPDPTPPKGRAKLKVVK